MHRISEGGGQCAVPFGKYFFLLPESSPNFLCHSFNMMKFSSSKRNMKFLKEIICIKLLTANNVGLYNTIFFWPFTVSPGEKDKLMQKNALFGQKTLIR